MTTAGVTASPQPDTVAQSAHRAGEAAPAYQIGKLVVLVNCPVAALAKPCTWSR